MYELLPEIKEAPATSVKKPTIHSVLGENTVVVSCTLETIEIRTMKR